MKKSKIHNVNFVNSSTMPNPMFHSLDKNKEQQNQSLAKSF